MKINKGLLLVTEFTVARLKSFSQQNLTFQSADQTTNQDAAGTAETSLPAPVGQRILGRMKEADFNTVVQQGAELQQRFPDKHLVAVGGTAAALHCGHRFSLDVDCVTPHLQYEYNEFAARLEDWPGWQTHRKNPPVLILGERAGVELGVRQLRRSAPLRTTNANGLVVPTLNEILRVKTFLLSERRATRDYVDFAALAQKAGEERTLSALAGLNFLYASTGSQSVVTRFAEACESLPADFAAVNLKNYKGLSAPFNDWDFVSNTCRSAGRQLLKHELDGKLPPSLPPNFE